MNCPICDEEISKCKCRSLGRDYKDRDEWKNRRSIVQSHLYLFPDEAVKHISELQRYWNTKYGDPVKAKILESMENKWKGKA